MKDAGARIGAHPRFGRVDVVAARGDGQTIFVETEGDTSRQKEQALYSALGQTILLTTEGDDHYFYALAVPDDPSWERQLRKIPTAVASSLKLKLYLVWERGVREIDQP